MNDCPLPEKCPFDQIRMGKLFERVDNILKKVNNIEAKVTEQNKEIGKLKISKAKIYTIVTVIAFIIPIAVTLIMKWKN